jgi:hypothetical protein
MEHNMTIVARLTAFAALLAALGCSGSEVKKITVKGKLMDGEKPFILDNSKLKLPAGVSLPPGSRPLQVAFIPVEKGDITFALMNPADGTFTVTAPAGKYKVGVVASAGPGTADFFGGKFANDKTQIERELKEGTDVVIDVSKPNGG